MLLFAPNSADLDAALATGGIAAVIVDPRADELAVVQAGLPRPRLALLLRGDSRPHGQRRPTACISTRPQQVAAARTLVGRDR